MRAHANHEFKFAFAFARVQGSQGTKLSHAAPFLTAIATFLAIVGLSSCAGYTSAAKTGPGTPVTSGSGILSASTITMSFGDVAVGNTATQILSITNSGTVVVNISQATISGAPFTITSGAPSGAVQVGQTVTMQVQFAPTTSGASNGAISVISDASNSPLAISLSGNGAQAGLSVSPASLTFANAIVGQTSSQTVKLTNTGSSSVVINMATVTGTAFGISGLTLPTTVSVGQAISFTTQFAPTAKHALLLAGLGWGNMPKPMVSEDLKRGRLVALDVGSEADLAYRFHTLYRADTPPGPAGGWLMERLAAA